MVNLWGGHSVRVSDCDERGLILANGEIIIWNRIEAIGKCEYPGRNLPWSVYFLREKGDCRNKRVSNLGGISLWKDDEREGGENQLKSKILEYGKKVSGLQFVTKTTHMGKEHPWDIEREMQFNCYYDSPKAKQASLEYKRRFPVLLLGFVVVVGVLFLGLWLVSYFLEVL